MQQGVGAGESFQQIRRRPARRNGRCAHVGRTCLPAAGRIEQRIEENVRAMHLMRRCNKDPWERRTGTCWNSLYLCLEANADLRDYIDDL